MSTEEEPRLSPRHEPRQEPEEPHKEAVPKGRKKRKWTWVHWTGWTSGIGGLLMATTLAILFFWASSAAFENEVRHRLIAALEDATGGRAEISRFHWNLLHLSIEAGGITIHGLEHADEAPYLHVEQIHLRVAILGLFHWGITPRIILSEAEIVKPSFHLIVYPDGSTNQPHPRLKSKPGKPIMDTLFEARIGSLVVSQGLLHIADSTVPLDLKAHDAELRLHWVPAMGNADVARDDLASYRIDCTVADMAFAQGKYSPVSSRLDASLLFSRDSVQLEAFHLAAMDHTLTVRGSLKSFAHPEWQAQLTGQVDLRLLAPYAGFDNTRSGIVNLNASASGHGAAFQAAGDLASNAIHYLDSVVDAQTSTFSAHFHADEKQLLVTDVRTHLARGGEVDGEFQYDNWLDTTPEPKAAEKLRREHKTWPVPTGVIRANLQGLSLDTILVFLAGRRYQHLGLDTIVSGPSLTTFSGLGHDLRIGGQLTLVPSAAGVPGEAPVNGFVDATYHADGGSIALKALEVHLPHSSIQGDGSLGVDPVTRTSAMNLDLQSSDLTEFDAVLRALDLHQGNRVGAAALPVALKGHGEFHGQFTGNWVTPRIDGHLSASNIGIQIPPSTADVAKPDAPLHFLFWDALDLDALYTPATIVVRHGLLKKGASSLSLAGHVDAADPDYRLDEDEAEFSSDSTLSIKATAQQFALSDLLPMAGISAPVNGTLNGQVNLDGKANALTGSGTLDVARMTLYGESIDHLHAAGTMADKQIRIANLTAQQGPAQSSGRLTATGSYDLMRRHFQLDARASAIDLGAVHEIRQAGMDVTGRLAFTATGEGTMDDPHLQAQATFSGMAIGGQPVSDLHLAASARQHAVTYDLNSHQLAGEFNAHGQTALNADYNTQASLQFSRFDIGGLLTLLHVTGISGKSDLEGTARIHGPLAHPEKMEGEASLNDLAFIVEGVHLESKGSLHAVLANGLAQLDPIEITGEDTDIKLGGKLSMSGSKHLDLVANGAVNLRLAESLDPDLIASGSTSFQMEAHGPLSDPILQGKVEFKNGSLALQDFPNGLSQIKGTLEFIQNRLEVRSLTAMSGGGQLSVGGYLGFQHGLYADLTATGKAIRIRYPQGISSLADANMRLLGPQNNLLLSGNIEVTRFAINSDLDLSSFTAQSVSVQPIVSPDAPSNHIRLDVHLTSAPQLNFQNAYAKLAGDVDLHLRGTLASPALLGRISLTEGSTSIGGTKYELQRGDIYFNNPVRIQPHIDLDATARVEDYDITLGLHGTPDKLNVTYRSEPPLPEADVIALLALGRTQSEQSSAYAQQQQQAGDNPATDALLGGALNATVSNRVQRLFGTGAIKVDPNFIGSIGNSTARVTVVEQIGKNLTFTYASNVNTTTQQLIQAEIAINRHVSLLLTQDESGIFSVVVKARRRYR